jgi:tetratricopeptide (TPR) repeat protein
VLGARKGLEALRLNTRILELDPENAAALTRRGLCSLAMDDLAAKQDLSHALKLRPSDVVEGFLDDVERGWNGWRERALTRVEDARAEAEKEQAEAEKERVEADRRAEDLRTVEATMSFEVAYAIGVARSKGDPPDYDLAVAALKKAYRVDPRRKVGPGEAPDPDLFEVPTRLARVLRDAGRLGEAEMMYLWVLERHDSRYARTGIAAVYEDGGEHQKALETYEGVLDRHPRDPYALRGIARTFSSLGRVDYGFRLKSIA